MFRVKVGGKQSIKEIVKNMFVSLGYNSELTNVLNGHELFPNESSMVYSLENNLILENNDFIIFIVKGIDILVRKDDYITFDMIHNTIETSVCKFHISDLDYIQGKDKRIFHLNTLDDMLEFTKCVMLNIFKEDIKNMCKETKDIYDVVRTIKYQDARNLIEINSGAFGKEGKLYTLITDYQNGFNMVFTKGEIVKVTSDSISKLFYNEKRV